VFCFCSDKVRKKRQTPARHGNDQAGEYQRVESVSSIVDHVGEHAEMYEEEKHSELYQDNPELYDQEYAEVYDDQMDNITVI
jgi:hypothetical protein